MERPGNSLKQIDGIVCTRSARDCTVKVTVESQQPWRRDQLQRRIARPFYTRSARWEGESSSLEVWRCISTTIAFATACADGIVDSRKTGLTLPERERDQYGLEEVDHFFSSPEKSPAKVNGNGSNTLTSEDMLESTFSCFYEVVGVGIFSVVAQC